MIRIGTAFSIFNFDSLLQTSKVENEGEKVIRAKTWVLSSDAIVIPSLSNISKNLMNSYLQYDNNVLEIKLDKNINYNSYLDLLLSNPPDLIIIVHPMVVEHSFFFQVMSSKQSLKIKFIIHVVGDFLRRSLSYLTLEHLFIGKDIHWLFPSKGYLAVTQSMFEDPSEAQFAVIPVLEDFFYDKKERDQLRKELNLFEDEVCFIYTGRVCEQKNIDLSLRMVKKCCQKLKKKFKFIIIGSFDDFEGASIGLPKKLGTIYNSISPLLDENVLLISHQKSQNLRRYYSCADVFVSLSCYHDESFGFSPLEALSSGTPCLLSQWGGYRDFSNESNKYCHLVSLELKQDGFEFSEKDFLSGLREILELSGHKEDCSKKFLKNYSALELINTLKVNVLGKTKSFKGFSAKYRKLTLRKIKEDKLMEKEFRRSYNFKIKLRSWQKNDYEAVYGPMWKSVNIDV